MAGKQEEKGEETWRRDVASHPWFILIPAVSLLRGPGGPALWGRDGGATVKREREERVWRERMSRPFFSSQGICGLN